MSKKLLIIPLLLLGFITNSYSQLLTNYTFSATSGTYTTLSGASAASLSTGNTDEGYYNNIPIGFTFWYMGTSYTTVSASTNGWLTFGANITNATASNSLSSGGAPRPIIAPLWDDIDVQASGNVSYLTTGSSGSRIFTIQYQNVKWQKTATGNTVSFQVKLNEADGSIRFVYNQESGSVSSGSASIGITSTTTGSGNFLSLNGTGSAPTASSTTETTNLSSRPSTNRTYTFTPPTPLIATNLTFTGILSNGMTLNWVSGVSDVQTADEVGYIIYKSTDSINYTLATQLAANITSSIQTGLSSDSTYYWKVYTLTEGGLSNPLTGSQATLCTPGPAPIVTSVVNYCQFSTASQLSATGTNLLWGAVTGTAGGTSTFASNVSASSSKKTNFATTVNNVQITTVDYTIPANQSVRRLVIALYNSSGTRIATSTTKTTLTAGATAVKITNSFYYNITTAGSYSIGVYSGSGNIGYDNPTFPLSEATGTVYVTGVSTVGIRCFNNIKFFVDGNATAPTPSTAIIGSTDYIVSQTVGGCLSSQATITVNVATPPISQVPTGDLIGSYTFRGNANDVSGNINNGLLQNSPALTTDRFGISNRAYSFNGSSQFMTTSILYTNPNDFTISIWFKTNTTSGGKLIGLGNTQTGQSTVYNRHIYMNNSGKIYFGVFPGTWKTINSSASYNDNNWHLATASLSSTLGMVLYVDGTQVAADPTTTTTEATIGYWRIGYDNLNSWPSTPSSYYFKGSLDDALIYLRVLSASEIIALFNAPDGAGSNGPACSGTTINLTAVSASGATYSWSGPNGFSSSSQNPSFAYSASNAGIYTLQVTSDGCTTTAYTNLVGSANAGQWTGNVSTDWATAGNWCTGVVPTSSTNVTIYSTAIRMPVISGTASCNSLTINTGAILTTTLAGTLNIKGTLSNYGTMANAGTTNFNGTTGQQTFTGVSSFYNLTQSNSNGLLLPSAINVVNDITLSAGILNSNNYQISVGRNWINNASATAFTAGTDTVTFNGIGAQSIGGSFTTSFNNLIIGSSTSLARTISIAGDLTVSTGVLDLASFNADRTSAGGTLSVANNATLKVGGTNTFPANYTTVSLVTGSTVEYSGNNQTISNQVYHHLKLSGTSGTVVKTLPATALTINGNLISVQATAGSVSYTAASDINVSGNVNIGTGTAFNGGSFSHNVAGNWTNEGTFTGSTSTITFAGTNAIISGSGSQGFNNLIIAASGIDFSSNSIALSGNLATTGSSSLTQTTGATLLMSGTGTTITGLGIALHSLSISGTVTTSATFSVNGNLIVSGSFTATNDTITLNGSSKTISGSGSIAFATINITGSISSSSNISIANSLVVAGSLAATAGTTTFTNTNALSGTANLYNVTVNGTSLQLYANAVLGVANTLSITSGILDVTSTLPNTINFNGSSAQTVSGISTFDNLTISNTAGVTAANDITVNDVLNLSVNNPSSTQGSLNLASDWASYPVSPSYSSYTLYMGATATTIGIGDVTGKVRRNTIVANTSYTFGNQFTAFSLSSGTMPTSMTIVIKIGAACPTYPTGVLRHYEILVPGGSNCYLTGHFYYLDAELNGNTEAKLVTGDNDFDGGFPLPDEHGRSSYDFVNNYIGLSNIPITYFIQSWRTIFQLFDYRMNEHKKWDGSVSTDWNNSANWLPIGVPSDAAFVTIPDSSTTSYDAMLPSGTTIVNNISIESGGKLVMGSNTLIINNSLSGGWEDQNALGNDPGTSTVVFAQRGATLSGFGRFYNVEIADTASLTLQTNAYVQIGNNITKTGSGAGLFYADIFNSTVEYNGGSQTVIMTDGIPNYDQLILSGSATKTMPASNLTIDEMLKISGSVTVSATNAISIEDSLIIGLGTTFNAGSASHSIGGNFINNGTFNAATSTITFNGIVSQNIKGSSATMFNNVVVNNAKGIFLEQDASINSTLNLTSGSINIANHNLSFANTANAVTGILNAANMIIADGAGEVRKYGNNATQASFTFPIGDAVASNNGAEYTPVTLTFIGGSYTSGYASAKVRDTMHPANASTHNHIARYWIINQSGYSGFSCNVSAHYLMTDVLGMESQIASAQRVGNTWVKYGVVDSITRTINATVNSLGYFTGISNNPVLVTIVGGDRSVCKDSTTTLQTIAVSDCPVIYLWSPNGETTSSISIPTSTIGSVDYSVTITCANGFTVADTATITVSSLPTNANAGTNETICIAGTTLSGNTPSIGTGVWSIVSAPSTSLTQISDITNPNAVFIPTGGLGVYQLQWTINNGACATSLANVTYTVTTTIWNGFTANWFDVSNWCGGLPTDTTDVTIPDNVSYMPNINDTGAVCRNINIVSGASLTMNGSSSLKVKGNFIIDGTFTAGGGKVLFDGTSLQTITSINSFSDLWINALASVITSNNIITNNINLDGILYLNNQNLTIGGIVTGLGKLSSGKTSILTINSTTNAGTIYFDQTTSADATIIDGTNALQDLIVNGEAGSITIGSKLNLFNRLSVSHGTLQANGNLVLRSTNSNTAYVDQVGGTINGQVVVERYMHNQYRGWRAITAPITYYGLNISDSSNSVKRNWQSDWGYGNHYGTRITGPAIPSAANGLDDYSPGVNLQTYNPATAAWNKIVNTVTETQSNATATAANKGFFLYIRGDRTVTPNGSNPYNFTSTTLASKGLLQTGTQVFNYAGASGQFWLIGNPYACPVDMSTIAANNIGQFVYVWDPNLANANLNTSGNYATYDRETWVAGPTTGGTSHFFQSGQAFFVLTTATNASITFAESDKVTSINNTHTTGIANGLSDILNIKLLSVKLDGTTSEIDGARAKFGNNYSINVDSNDAAKWSTTGIENISFKRSAKLLSIESRPYIISSDTLFLNLAYLNVGSNYQFKINPINFDASVSDCKLVDNFLNTQTSINLGYTSTIDFNVTSITGSNSANRFYILFNATGNLPTSNNLNLKAYKQNNSVVLNWKTIAENNIKNYSVEKSIDGINFKKLADVNARNGNTNNEYIYTDNQPVLGFNYYRIQSTEVNNNEHFSSIEKVEMTDKDVKSISVYPNPVIGRKLGILLNNMIAGKYIVKMFNTSGQEVWTSTFGHNGNNGNISLQLDATLSVGSYVLQIIDSKGDSLEQTILIAE